MITLGTLFANGFMSTEVDQLKNCDGTPVTYKDIFMRSLEDCAEGATIPNCNPVLPQPFDTRIKNLFIPEKGGLTNPMQSYPTF